MSKQDLIKSKPPTHPTSHSPIKTGLFKLVRILLLKSDRSARLWHQGWLSVLSQQSLWLNRSWWHSWWTCSRAKWQEISSPQNPPQPDCWPKGSNNPYQNMEQSRTSSQTAVGISRAQQESRRGQWAGKYLSLSPKCLTDRRELAHCLPPGLRAFLWVYGDGIFWHHLSRVSLQATPSYPKQTNPCISGCTLLPIKCEERQPLVLRWKLDSIVMDNYQSLLKICILLSFSFFPFEAMAHGTFTPQRVISTGNTAQKVLEKHEFDL